MSGEQGGPLGGGRRSGQSEPPAAVLVVDDDTGHREMLRRLLKGYRVLEAPGGAEALARVAQGGVDLVLLDVMMPGQSGLEVCRELKARPADLFLPVLLLTGLAEQEDRNAGLAAGADDFLSKPVDRNELLLRVRAFLRLREQERLIREQLAELHRMHLLKDDLFNLLVHDLRNPLASLRVFLSFLSQETARLQQPTLQEDVAGALVASERLGHMFDELLEVRLLEESQLQARCTPTLALEVAEEALDAVAGQAREREVRVVLVRQEEPVAGLDRRLVRRALENLLSNAVKYSPHGGTVELLVREQPGQLCFEVLDRGPGVPDVFKTQLFQKYGTVLARETRQRQGYGLGLYFVHLAALAHGGGVEVDDRPGGGAVFRLRLPA